MIDVITDSEARLQATTTAVGYRCLLSLAGEVNLDTLGVLETALKGVLRSAERDIWIDLTGVTFLDPTAVRLLADARTQLDGDRRTLAIIVPDGPIRRTIDEAGLGTRLPLFRTRHDAHRST